MIITLTANPSLDRTVSLSQPLQPGGVHRIVDDHTDPGGKGVNVARVCQEAGIATTAVLPARPGDRLLTLLDRVDLDVVATPSQAAVRTNLTVVDPAHVTTKINEGGATLTDADATQMIDAVIHRLQQAMGDGDDNMWVVLAGSLPKGVATDFYADCVQRLREYPVTIAVDTSDEPLVELARRFPAAAPDVMKPNAFELAQIVGGDGQELEDQAIAGNPQPVVDAARKLIDRGVTYVVATMGAGGAVVVSADEAWFGQCPATTARSTVGAGDASLAGFVLAGHRGLDVAQRLAWAVSYGAAAVEKEGTQPPLPGDVHRDKAVVTPIAD